MRNGERAHSCLVLGAALFLYDMRRAAMTGRTNQHLRCIFYADGCNVSSKEDSRAL